MTGATGERGAPISGGSAQHRSVTQSDKCIIKPLSDSRRVALAAALLATRRRVGIVFPENLFADPAMDLLLDLYVAACTSKKTSVSSACIAAAVPQTTALRWIYKLASLDLVEINRGCSDRRITLVRLTDRAIEHMAAYLDYVAQHLRSVL